MWAVRQWFLSHMWAASSSVCMGMSVYELCCAFMCIDFVLFVKQVVGNHMTRTHKHRLSSQNRTDAELICALVCIVTPMYCFSTIPSSAVLSFTFHSHLRSRSPQRQRQQRMVCAVLEEENRFIWSLELRRLLEYCVCKSWPEKIVSTYGILVASNVAETKNFMCVCM